MMTPQKQGYVFIAITMCIWGGFTLTARLSANWGIGAWDITALRFLLAFCILMPILIYKKDTAFLWKKEPFILAMIGGVCYCITAYSAFHYVPAAHAAIFLNGCIPLCTAVAAYLLFRQPFDRHTWLSLSIMLLALTAMSVLMYQETGVAFSLGDGLFFLSAVLWGTFTVLLRMETVGMALHGRCCGLGCDYFCADLCFIPTQNHSACATCAIDCSGGISWCVRSHRGDTHLCGSH